MGKKRVTLDYDSWAEKAIITTDRKGQEWNYTNFIKVINDTGLLKKIKSIAEVGGADGYNLSQIVKESCAIEVTNYELAKPHVEKGRAEHPEIKFVQGDFMKIDAEPVDLIMFSDVVEHVEDDEKFMEKCARCGRYGLFKIPVEDAYYIKLQIVAGRRVPPGPNHPSGHIRDYTYGGAIALVGKYFEVLAVEYPDYTEVTPKNTFFGKMHAFMFGASRRISSGLCSALFGGPIFVLCKSRLYNEG